MILAATIDTTLFLRIAVVPRWGRWPAIWAWPSVSALSLLLSESETAASLHHRQNYGLSVIVQTGEIRSFFFGNVIKLLLLPRSLLLTVWIDIQRWGSSTYGVQESNLFTYFGLKFVIATGLIQRK